MLMTEIGDPRLKSLFGAADTRSSNVRPVVRLERSRLSPLVFGVSALAAGMLLFAGLNERRMSQRQPSAAVGRTAGSPTAWQAPPPLYIPPAQEQAVPEVAIGAAAAAPPGAEPASGGAFAAPVPIHVLEPHSAQPRARLEPLPLAPARPEPLISSGAPLAIDEGAGGGGQPALPPVLGVTGPRAAADLPDSRRVHSTSLANPSLTVPEGTLIPAVLETGFDSTKPSFARALVSKDVHGFDGRNILIPRGSRLVGESSAPAAEGQKRAVITWTRLILPDGTTVDIDSPTTDPVGRVGVKASVDTHVLSRVGNAIGRTILDLGRAFIGRSGPLVLLSGGEPAGQSRLISRPAKAPVLKLAPGTAIGVFLARDLEFDSAGDRR